MLLHRMQVQLPGDHHQYVLVHQQGPMTLSGYTGTVVKWQKHVDAGLWTDIANTTATYSEIPSSAGTMGISVQLYRVTCNRYDIQHRQQ